MATLYHVATDELGKAICKLLNLDHTTVSAIDIHIRPSGPVIVEISRVISTEDSLKLEKILLGFQMIPQCLT